jgi:hypothetical protein
VELTKYFRIAFGIGIAALIAATPLSALAQTYGQSTYGSCDFGGSGTSSCATGGNSGGGSNSGGSNINLGPVSLPITGPGAWATWGTVALIVAALLFYWALTHRKRRRTATVKSEEL